MAVDMRKTLEYVDQQIANLTEVRNGIQKLLNTAGTPATVQTAAAKRTAPSNGELNRSGDRRGMHARTKAKRGTWRFRKQQRENGSNRVMNPGETLSIITRALQDGPLDMDALYKRAQQLGWKSNAGSPKGAFYAAVYWQVQRGTVRKIGSDYELPPTLENTPAVEEALTATPEAPPLTVA